MTHRNLTAQHSRNYDNGEMAHAILSDQLGADITALTDIPMPKFPTFPGLADADATELALKTEPHISKFFNTVSKLATIAKAGKQLTAPLPPPTSSSAAASGSAKPKPPQVLDRAANAGDWCYQMRTYLESSGNNPNAPRSLALAATYLSQPLARRWDQRKQVLERQGKQPKFDDFKAVVLTGRDGTHPADAARTKFTNLRWQPNKPALDNLTRFRVVFDQMSSSCAGTRTTPVSGYERFTAFHTYIDAGPPSIKTVLLSDSQTQIAAREDADGFLSDDTSNTNFYNELMSAQLDKAISLARMLPSAIAATTLQDASPKSKAARATSSDKPGPAKKAKAATSSTSAKPSAAYSFNVGKFRQYLKEQVNDGGKISEALYGNGCMLCGKDHHPDQCTAELAAANAALPPARRHNIQRAANLVAKFKQSFKKPDKRV